MKYMSVTEAANKWNINERRVRVLLKEKRIEGAKLEGHKYLIPVSASKPLDRRIKGQRLFEDSPLLGMDFDFKNYRKNFQLKMDTLENMEDLFFLLTYKKPLMKFMKDI